MSKRLVCCIFCAGIIFCQLRVVAQTLSFISEVNDPNCGCVQLENPPKADTFKKEDLQVFLFHQDPDNPSVPIIGKWMPTDNNLYFCPLIPFSKNLTYQARFPNLPYLTFKTTPPKDYQLTELVNIFPTTTYLPENTLKMYLYFSAPMSDSNGYFYLRLEDANGNEIEAPFLDLKPLLWNEDRTRLTLWFDPGRVKRDLIKNRKMGAPLKAGRQYTLFVDKNWKDVNGYSLAAGFEKKIEVIAADRSQPTPKKWRANQPKANTKQPVIIKFGEPLDHALALTALTIFTKKGKRVKGAVRLQNEDRQWIFIPDDPWVANDYRIQIRAELEDLAGNNLNRLFDTDLEQEATRQQNLPYYYFDFLAE